MRAGRCIGQYSSGHHASRGTVEPAPGERLVTQTHRVSVNNLGVIASPSGDPNHLGVSSLCASEYRREHRDVGKVPHPKAPHAFSPVADGNVAGTD
jgi:hypothetical protein